MVDPFYPKISLMPARNHLDHCDQQHHLCFLTHYTNTMWSCPILKEEGLCNLVTLQRDRLQEDALPAEKFAPNFFRGPVTWAWRIISFYSNGARKYWPKDILGSSKIVTDDI